MKVFPRGDVAQAHKIAALPDGLAARALQRPVVVCIVSAVGRKRHITEIKIGLRAKGCDFLVAREGRVVGAAV